jgi:hypothetical protein
MPTSPEPADAGPAFDDLYREARPRLTRLAWLLVGTRGVTITPDHPAEVHTTSFPPPVHADPVDLTPGVDVRRSDGALVQVVTVPDGVEAVEVRVPSGGGKAMGYAYERPRVAR